MYSVATANGSKVNVLSQHPTRGEALSVMSRTGGMTVALNPAGRIIGSTLARSVGR